MNLADTLRGLLRRWYIVVPGIVLAVAAAIGAFATVEPGYERTATQLLLPGEGTVPKGTTNPYLFLGGLTQAADIVVRVMQSDEVLGPVVSEYPGTEVQVQRDPMVSGPVIQIVVTAKSDAAAEGSLAALVDQTAVVLAQLQTAQNVDTDDMMTVSTLTMDTTSSLQQKTRLVISAGVGLAVVVLTLLLASLIDGLSRRTRRSGRQRTGVTTVEATELDALDDADVNVREDAADGQEASADGHQQEAEERAEAHGASVDRTGDGDGETVLLAGGAERASRPAAANRSR